MNTKHWISCWQLGLIGLLTSAGINAFTCKTLAQSTPSNIQPDSTLGAESSRILQNFQGLPIEVIAGGASRGINLFHSLREFNVSEGRGAYFFSPSAEIQNIFARVTGANRSEILGTLGTFGNSQPSLFLINPNGIIFGKNASLDLQGSFVGTTATSVKFADGKEFSTTAPQSSPLLTISVPLGLQFNANSGKITVQGDGTGLRSTTDLIDTNSGLRVPSNQTLALIGGDINLEGATIKTAGGRIELGSVSGEGLVSLNPTDKGFLLGYGGVQNFGNIQLTQKASVDASGAGAGDVQVTGKRVTLSDGSQIETSTLGANNGGGLVVNAAELVELNNPSSGLFAQVYAGATGNGGNLTISTKNLLVNNGAQVNTDTLGAGNGGNLTVNASGSVQLIGGGLSSLAQPDSTGNAGDIKVNAQTINLSNQAIIKSSNAGQGNAGNILIQAQDDFSANNSLILSNIGSPQGQPALGNVGNIEISAKTVSLSDGAQLQAGFFSGGKGNAGIVSVKAQDTISFAGTNSGIFADVESGAVGNGSDIQISGKSVSFNDGAVVVTSNAGQGNAGNILIQAQDDFSANNSLILSNIGSPQGQPALGNVGNIEISARTVSLSNGAQLQAGFYSGAKGNAGIVSVKAQDTISFTGTNIFAGTNSGIFANVLSGAVGNGSDIQISARSVSFTDGAFVLTNNAGQGNAGNILIQAQDNFSANNNSLISSSIGSPQGQPALGNVGNIEISARTVSLSNGAQLQAGFYSGGEGNAGLVSVKAQDTISFTGTNIFTGANSGIFAKVESGAVGNGGDIQISAPSVSLTDGAVLSSSNEGEGNGGNIQLQARSLALTNGGSIGTQTFGRGNSGDLLVNASDSVSLSGIITLINPQTGEKFTTGSRLATNVFGTGNGGQLTINTGRLSVLDGGDITTASSQLGRAGNLTINAKDSVEVVGTSINATPSTISTSTFGSGDAGNITINTGLFSIRNGALVSASTSGKGNGGNLNVNASDGVQLIGSSADGRFSSSLLAGSTSTGNAGDLTIKTQDLLVRDGAVVSTGTVGAGKGGNLTVNATGTVQLTGTTANSNLPSALSTNTGVGSTGNAGDLTITTQDLFVQDGARVTTATSGSGKGGNLTVKSDSVEVIGASANGSPSKLSASANQGLTGNAGDLTINTQNLLLRDGGQVDAATFGQGKGGNLTVNANSSVKLIGTTGNGNFPSGLFASAEVGSTGNAGELTVNTPDLLVQDGARVTTATSGAGKGGNLNVNAANRVQLTGTSVDGRFSSTLSTSANQGATGNAGDLTIKTQDLLVQDGAQVGASTLGQGNAGNLTVNASHSVQLIGRSADSPFLTGLAAAALNSSGNGGDLTIKTPQLLVRDGARVSVANTGTGNAGIMTINADTINLDNNATLSANTRSPNKDPNREQATINLNTQNLTLRHGSSITTNATGENVFGGNINIYTKFLIAVENSRISANSDNSRGGRVVVNARGVFVGTQPSDVTKYITATSGVGLPGTVEVNSPDNSSIINSFAELFPTIDTNALIADSCIVRGDKRQENSFFITGSGALNPNRPGGIVSNYTTGEVRGVVATSRPWKKGDPIIEPTGVYRLSNGQILLSRECSN
jgi:filamentous hemagglutinin family protein